MREDIKAKKFDFEDIEGLSPSQLNQHYQLYKGYVNKVNEIWNILEEKKIFKNPNSTYSKMRSLQLGQSYALDGVKLHELYFENLGGENKKIYGKAIDLIERDFESYDFFYERFKNTGLSMRGWVVLGIDSIDKKLHIFGSDAHDVGAIWLAYPLLVMDVYEHAYMIDFGIDRKAYIDVFMKNINWKVVNKRIKAYSNWMDENKSNLKKMDHWSKYCKEE